MIIISLINTYFSWDFMEMWYIWDGCINLATIFRVLTICAPPHSPPLPIRNRTYHGRKPQDSHRMSGSRGIQWEYRSRGQSPKRSKYHQLVTRPDARSQSSPQEWSKCWRGRKDQYILYQIRYYKPRWLFRWWFRPRPQECRASCEYRKYHKVQSYVRGTESNNEIPMSK